MARTYDEDALRNSFELRRILRDIPYEDECDQIRTSIWDGACALLRGSIEDGCWSDFISIISLALDGGADADAVVSALALLGWLPAGEEVYDAQD